MDKPDFFISSSEYEAWDKPLACYVLGRIKGPRTRGYWWVRVEPPVPGYLCGSPFPVSELILAERYKDDDLADLSDEPVTVYVCFIKNHQAVEKGLIQEEDVDLVAWADVTKNSSQGKRNKGVNTS